MADLLDAADDEKRSELQHQLHTARFKVTTTSTPTPVVFDGTVPSLVGQLLAHNTHALRSQHHVHMKTEAWGQDAAANHGLGSCLPSSVVELGAGAGAGGAAVRSPQRYIGGPMIDDHDRLAIHAITEAALPHHLPRNKIAKEAGTFSSSSAFKRKFEMYEGKVGRGWKCTEATATAKRGKQYELA
jgi:hypothetical protein